MTFFIILFISCFVWNCNTVGRWYDTPVKLLSERATVDIRTRVFSIAMSRCHAPRGMSVKMKMKKRHISTSNTCSFFIPREGKFRTQWTASHGWNSYWIFSAGIKHHTVARIKVDTLSQFLWKNPFIRVSFLPKFMWVLRHSDTSCRMLLYLQFLGWSRVLFITLFITQGAYVVSVGVYPSDKWVLRRCNYFHEILVK